MAPLLSFLSATLLLIVGANAQFQFFEQMFNQGGQQQHHQAPQNVPSDSNWYQENYNSGLSPFYSPIAETPNLPIQVHYLFPVLCWEFHGLIANIACPAHCSNYLCPDTLACVHFPHHCPCPHPTYEEKFELGDGKAICVSKGGFKAGEAGRKVELARKGLL
jgi:hypothetical protein